MAHLWVDIDKVGPLKVFLHRRMFCFKCLGIAITRGTLPSNLVNQVLVGVRFWKVPVLCGVYRTVFLVRVRRSITVNQRRVQRVSP